MMSKFKGVLICCLLGFNSSLISAQNPHIIVNQDDRLMVLEKVRQQAWAGKIYQDIYKRVTPYVERHVSDPQWILSRYLMNRIPGKRFTTVYSDEGGLKLVRWEGDAPCPTVRVSTYLRSPITDKGTSYRKPAIEELVPNDTSKVMLLFNPETGQKEWVDPQAYITDLNGDFNELALDAAIIYWLKGGDQYAKFAADLLDQWAKGVYYQNPIVGPCRTGLLDMQTLGDQSYRSIILAYDFVKPFMKLKGYDLKWYETVFEKFASTLSFRGFWNNNWYAAESSTLAFAALSLENKEKRDYYLQFILKRDTINGSCGQLALPSTVKKWLTPDGHWKEPGGYHNYPVGNLLLTSLALEKNGYEVFRQFPQLFKASYAMIKYSFPNLTVGGFGDTGRASQSAESLEIGLIGAVKYNQPELPEMLAGLNQLINNGLYKREKSGFVGLLTFLPDLPTTSTSYHWPRTGNLDFAKYFLQRNGTDPQTGLMVGIQGATYNHNHCNGMAMELYGLGEVMGIDAGTGPNYEHPLHRNYFSQWAAHNTVVAAGASSSVPFSGSAGAKNIGQIELKAMEPMPDSEAISPNYSFTDTRYFDKSTNTRQSRTLAIIRTSSVSGYYVDIFRSDNQISNDYVYHNIGDQVTFYSDSKEQLQTVKCDYPLTGKDYPGFRFFTEVEKLEGYHGTLNALFTARDKKSNDLFMQVLIPEVKGRTFFTAKSPKTKTAGEVYNGKPLPLFTIRTEREAWSKPFVAVYEPFKGRDNQNVVKVELETPKNGKDFTILKVNNQDLSQQIIFQSINDSLTFRDKNCEFSGFYGVVGFKDQKISSLYLGSGKFITYSGYTLKFEGKSGAANMVIKGNVLKVDSNQPVEVSIPKNEVRRVSLIEGAARKKIKIVKRGSQVYFTLPTIHDGEVLVE